MGVDERAWDRRKDGIVAKLHIVRPASLLRGRYLCDDDPSTTGGTLSHPDCRLDSNKAGVHTETWHIDTLISQEEAEEQLLLLLSFLC